MLKIIQPSKTGPFLLPVKKKEVEHRLKEDLNEVFSYSFKKLLVN